MRSQRRRGFQSTHFELPAVRQQQELQQEEDEEGLQAVDWAAMLPNRKQALAHMRELLSYLPLSSQLAPPKVSFCF